MRGSRLPLELRERFRAEYLYSGNASAVARKIGIPTSTASDLVEECYNDPSFVEARKKLRERILDDVERQVDDVVRVATRRFKGKLPKIPEGAVGVTVIDKRAEYGKLVIDAHRTLYARKKIDVDIAKAAQPSPSEAPAINIYLADGTKVDSSDKSEPEPEAQAETKTP